MVYKLNNSLASTTKFSLLNDMILETDGKVSQSKFDKHELDAFFTDTGLPRKFLRDQELGHTLGTYTGWTHLYAETGYGIWKFSPTTYTYNAYNQVYFDDKLLENRGEAISETATAFTKVYLYDGATTSYIDNTTEAGTEAGTAFNLMNATNDYLYMGLATTFSGLKFEFDTKGVNYGLKVEYYNGAWTELLSTTNELDDQTDNFEVDGNITWNIPIDWATLGLFSGDVAKYYVRISTTTTPVTVAQASLIIPGNSIIGLLSLTNTQVLNEEWAWASYGSAVYVTIKNTGNSSYEGNFYITSASGSDTLKDFFIYNHTFMADYEDSSYIAASGFDHGTLNGLGDNDHTQYVMDVTAAPLTLIDQEITFNYSTSDFDVSGNNLIIKSTVKDHGNLTGLSDDDHTQYLKVDGTRAMSGSLLLGSDGSLGVESNDVVLKNLTSNEDLLVKINDGGTTKTVMNIDSSEAEVILGSSSSNDTISIPESTEGATISSKANTSSTTGALILNALQSLYLNIDSDNGSTTQKLVIGKNRTGSSSGTDLFEILEDGTATLLLNTLNLYGATSLCLGKEIASGSINTPGVLKFIGAGDNPYYTTFTAGTQSANATYTLPTALPASNKVLQSTSGGVLSWESVTTTNTRTGQFTITIDNHGSVISTGVKFDIPLGFNGTFIGWMLQGTPSGSVVLDLWKDLLTNGDPTNDDAIPGAGKEPTITSSTYASDSDISDWTTVTFASGDTLRGNIDSCTNITRLSITLIYVKDE